jgi:hypothetical protein
MWHTDSRSQAQQDRFVYTVLGGKRCGTWLELGAGHPHNGNNTWYLEKHLGWTGTSIELQDFTELWQQQRTIPLTVADAMVFDYSTVPYYVDYLQIDLDDAQQALDALTLVVARHKFSVVTFEHDVYCGHENNEKARSQSRQLLESLGYVCLVPDVTLEAAQIPESTAARYSAVHWSFEDWWIHPDHVRADHMQFFSHLGPGPNYINEIFLGGTQ